MFVHSFKYCKMPTKNGASRLYLLMVWFLLLMNVNYAASEQDAECFSSGSLAGAIIGTFLVTVILIGAAFFLWKYYWRSRKGKHLVLESDPENVGDQYAFDNPCFKDGGIPQHQIEKNGNKPDVTTPTKTKWSWSPLSALSTNKNEKRRTLDDTYADTRQVNLVSLRSHDFTGLGFNIYGNMRDGIFIKDVLHRGPASESGKINSGDRIVSVRISFAHMVYEDALTILSYASPYEVQLEVENGGKIHHKSPGSKAVTVVHPLYKSGSSGDLTMIGKSVRQRLFQTQPSSDESVGTDYSTLKLSSKPTTLERPQSKLSSDDTLSKPERTKKPKPATQYSPSALKAKLEHSLKQNENKLIENITHTEDDIRINIENPEFNINRNSIVLESEIQKTSTDLSKKGFQKFGVRVLPLPSNESEPQANSPKHAESSQNENNINYERHFSSEHPVPQNPTPDVVDHNSTNVLLLKKNDDQTNPLTSLTNTTMITNVTIENQEFNRQNSRTGSGIKRDKAGIPQEIPDHMLNAANAARKNRKSADVTEQISEIVSNGSAEKSKSAKKPKGKAPAPPNKGSTELDFEDSSSNLTLNTLESSLDSIEQVMNFTDDFEPTMTNIIKEKFPNSYITVDFKNDSTDIKTTNNNSNDTQTTLKDIITTKTENKEEEIVIHSDSKSNESEENKVNTSKPIITNNFDANEKLVESNNYDYSSDSDADTDQNSVINNMIELNSSDITIHHSSGESENTDVGSENRKAASLGDLSKFEKGRINNSGTLERAMSLDITDTGIPNLCKKRKASNRPEEEIDDNFNSDEYIYSNSLLKNKEPRLSLALDNLSTFQGSRLKKSSEWGNLEDAIVNINSNTSGNTLRTEDIDAELCDREEMGVQPVNKKIINNVTTTKMNNLDSEELKVELVPEAIRVEMEPENEGLVEKETMNKIVLNTSSNEITGNTGHQPKFNINIGPYQGTFEVTGENVSLTNFGENLNTINIIENSTQKDVIIEPENICDTRTETGITFDNTILEKTPTLLSNSLEDTKERLESCLKNTSESLSLNDNFINEKPLLTEKLSLSFTNKLYETNASDDIKVSRHSLGSLERPKSDVLKNVSKLKQLQSMIQSDQGGVSNVTIMTETDQSKLENNLNNVSKSVQIINNFSPVSALNNSFNIEKSEVTIIDNNDNNSIPQSYNMKVNVEPDLIISNSKNISHLQINHTSDDTENNITDLYTTAIDTSLPHETMMGHSMTEDAKLIEVLSKSVISDGNEKTIVNMDSTPELPTSPIPDKIMIQNGTEGPSSLGSATFVTEIQVTTSNNNNKNVSGIKVNNINLQATEIDNEKSPKKLTEMKFTTSSYENTKTPEKKASQIELLRSTFEKTATGNNKSSTSPTKSKIPIATSKLDAKISPERTINLKTSEQESGDDREIIDIMTKSSAHSTPLVQKYSYTSKTIPIKATNNKNITVTSIKTSSKIPSGYSNAGNYPSRPPIPPRRADNTQISSLNSEFKTHNTESSFQQWVFNPTETKGANVVYERKKE